MAQWHVTIRNRTGKSLLLQRKSQSGLVLPAEIADDASVDIQSEGAGDLDYMVRPGELFGLKWSDATGVESYAVGLKETVQRSGNSYDFTVTAAPPYCTWVYVASGSGATICIPDYRKAREHIAQAAENEAEKWEQVDRDVPEKDRETRRLPLRMEYATAWATEGQRNAMRRSFATHDSDTKSWCGVFGVWAVQRGQPTGVEWTLKPVVGGGPVGVLKCTDVNKIHTGDIGHVFDDMQDLARRIKEWEDGGQVGGKPVVPNHHVLVTRGGARPLTTVEGNGANFANPLNLVVRNERALGRSKGRVDFFYCAVPHPRCVVEARQKGRPEDCPRNDPAMECALPDP